MSPAEILPHWCNELADDMAEWGVANVERNTAADKLARDAKAARKALAVVLQARQQT